MRKTAEKNAKKKMERTLTEQKNSRILGKGKTAKKEKSEWQEKQEKHKDRKEKKQKVKKNWKEEKKKRRDADQGESNSCMSPCPLDGSQVLTPARIKSALYFANAFVHSAPSPLPTVANQERLIKQKKARKKKLKQNSNIKLDQPETPPQRGEGGDETAATVVAAKSRWI